MHMLEDHKHDRHVGLRYVEKVVVLGADEHHRHFYFVISEKQRVGSSRA